MDGIWGGGLEGFIFDVEFMYGVFYFVNDRWFFRFDCIVFLLWDD